jgi:peptidoglycan-N-acetylglucosamine deacetylase
MSRRRLLVSGAALGLAVAGRQLARLPGARADDPNELPYGPETLDPDGPGPLPLPPMPQQAARPYTIVVPGIAFDGQAEPPPPPPPPPPQQFEVPLVFYRGDLNSNRVYLTIDDCYTPSLVVRAMDIAEAAGARLTFFPVGNLIANQAAHWRGVYRRGHGIENHSFTHPRFSRLSEPQMRGEIRAANNAIRDALQINYVPRFFRPPYGDGIFNPDERLPRVVDELGMKVAVWNADSNGWRVHPRTDGAAVTYAVNNVLRNLGPGAIVLQHGIPTDIAALPRIIDEVRRRGLQPVAMRDGLR